MTPVYAGKSGCATATALTARNHPRVRGEELMQLSGLQILVESPPRAQGRGLVELTVVEIYGITPACAGKSGILRLRDLAVPESPPRARGRGLELLQRERHHGITPACAGKSRARSARGPSARNHPRVRGEEEQARKKEYADWESPPRARGRALDGLDGFKPCGITPACAGKRRIAMSNKQSNRNHPRVRGEE